jgi:ATP-dependent DNA helicase RecQ
MDFDLDTALHDHFGFAAFRPGQREAVEAAVAGRDALIVMPTGAGKSLCYQLPALLRDDLTIVVSPLVSLMQDQVTQLEARAPGRAALINAQQDAGVNRAVVDRAASGELKLLYVAPERFASPIFLERIRAANVGLFVVDEAHCVSQWGHDFRPDYFRLADAARWLDAGSLLALTATATPTVAKDIAERLALDDPAIVTTGFDRPNLSFAVVPCRGALDKERRIASVLADAAARPAIIYAGTRAQSERLAGRLGTELGIAAAPYHAGLARDLRASVQARFMAGELELVVATNAFGMGVDKADVRTVCHASVPESVEAWYQEAGRAGRDGAPARCLLFAENRDKGLHVHFIQRAEVGEADVKRVAAAIGAISDNGRYDMGRDDLARAAGCDREQVGGIIGHLARAGALAPAPAGADRAAGKITSALDSRTLGACRSSIADAERARWARYRTIWGLVEGDTCRRETILRHFGDPDAPHAEVPCCDVCDPGLVPAPAAGGTKAEERAARGGRPGGGRRGRAASPRAEGVPAGVVGDLDAAIVTVVTSAEPAVGRTRCVEVLRGGRSKVVVQYGYDGLPGYGAYAHLHGDDVLSRVDALIADGVLRSTGGRFPKLAVHTTGQARLAEAPA